MEGERSVGVFQMAVSTRVLPIMDMSISGALRVQLTMLIVSGCEVALMFSERTACDAVYCLYTHTLPDTMSLSA